MDDNLNVSVTDLYASAGAATTLVSDLQSPLRKAIDDIAAAGSAFRAWDEKGRIEAVSTGWGDALATLKDHLAEHANGLRLLADGHSVTEADVRDCFSGW
uniref:WXG100 family type VII secretion target n=1 Tax=Streptomyces sp. NBC_00008 TaxID=2903610 RepID=A0AAU2VM22_9ACTN